MTAIQTVEHLRNTTRGVGKRLKTKSYYEIINKQSNSNPKEFTFAYPDLYLLTCTLIIYVK